MTLQNLRLNVPTTYVGPRTSHLRTIQYDVIYERQFKPHSSVAGIIFRFDVEPVRLNFIYHIFPILHPVRRHPSIRIS